MTERRETGRKVLGVATPVTDWSQGERIAKWLASAGVCSRREAERLIEAGDVTVNGKVLETPAHKVTGREDIRVAGKRVGQPDKARMWRYHKPKGLVTTNSDPEGRATVFEHLPKGLPRVMTIGRLDLNTEGLLLLTNDGELARALELPSTGLKRKYRARAYGEITQEELDTLKDGIVYEGIEYRSIIARLVRTTGDNNWIDMTLTEGKKREARRALESVGLRVNRLIRVSYGPFELGDLKDGQAAEISAAELLAEFGQYISRKRRPNPSKMPDDILPAQSSGSRKPSKKSAGDATKPVARKGKSSNLSDNKQVATKSKQAKKPDRARGQNKARPGGRKGAPRRRG